MPINDWTFRADIRNLSNYYPYGMQLPKGTFSATDDYSYGYNGMEKDDELRESLYSTLFREGDTENGRWWSRDPLEMDLVGFSPYMMMGGNPISLIDIDGKYPIYFITRSYAPFKTFGPGYNWYGDDRGHTLDRGASYRSMVSIKHDTELLYTTATGGHSRSHTVDGTKDAVSPTVVEHNKSKGRNIDVHSSGRNAAQFGSFDIDQFTKLKVYIEGDIKGDHILSITGAISGDDFPNQESMIYDNNGNTLWLGNYQTFGDREWGPVTDLPLENEGEININVNIRIKVNSKGIFQGVIQTGEDGKEKMISIEDWNKKME